MGNYAFYECSKLKNIIGADGVVSIGESAFYYCSNLKSIVLADSLTSIGEDAFNNCSALESISIPVGVKTIEFATFSECSSLSSVIIPDGLTSIGNCSFMRCSSLKNIDIPASVSVIGTSAFAGCGNVNISVDENNAYYSSLDGALFNKDKSAIINYSKDTIQPEYTIPSSVKTIEEGAFGGCYDLTKISIPSSVENIKDIAFQVCESLTSVTIPEGVISIGRNAFLLCTGLTNLSIPSTVSSIGSDPLLACGNVNISVDEKNEYYSSFDGVLFNKDKTEIIEYAKDKVVSDYTVPYGVTSIGMIAFEYRTGLKNISLSNSVNTVKYAAFWGCTGLTAVTIPDSISLVEDSAFYNCQSLTDVYYTGTQEQWEQISIGKNNTYLQNATIHYNCSSELSRPVCQINGAVASADKMTVFVSSSLGAVNNTMLIAKYKSGVLIGLTEKQIDLSADSNEVVFENFAKGNADMIKIMLWSRAEPFKPLCGEYTIL
ncbi:MAG: leucine-rich repeat domain-containing protein [Monoglobaceae bacterium]